MSAELQRTKPKRKIAISPISSSDMRTAHEIVARIKQHEDVSLQDFANWFLDEINKFRYETFKDHVQSLPQADNVPDGRIKAWIWTFYHDPVMLAMDEATRNKYLSGACGGLAKLSAYDAAIVAQEIANPDSFSYAFKTAENIRRNLLLRDMYASIPQSPETRLRNHARTQMEKDAWKLVHTRMNGTDKYIRTTINKGRDGDLVSAYGQRYAFLKSEFEDGKELWFPVLLVADNDDCKEREYLYEFGSLYTTLSEDTALGGCVVVSIHPTTILISPRFIGNDTVKPYAKEVSESVDFFWKNHVLPDIPMTWKKKEDRIDLEKVDPELFKQYRYLTNRCAKFNVLEKKAKEASQDIRKSVYALIRKFAYQHKVPETSIEVPREALSPARGKKVRTQELQYIIDTMPDAAEAVFKKVEADPKLMEAKLQELNVDITEYCVGVPDADLVEEFCTKNGIVPPIDHTFSLRLASNSKSGKHCIELIEKELESVYDKLNIS